MASQVWVGAQVIKEPMNEATSNDPGLRLDLVIRGVWQQQEVLFDVHTRPRVVDRHIAIAHLKPFLNLAPRRREFTKKQ